MIKILKEKIFYFIILICLVIGSKDTFFSVENRKIMYIGIFLSLILLSVPVLKRGTVPYKKLEIYIFLNVLVFLSMIFNLDFSGYSLLIVLANAMLVTENLEFELFYKKFENLIFIICAISLIAVALKIVGCNTALSVFIRIVDNEALPWKFRLYGIFREPAMYCIYCGLALARQLFLEAKPCWFRIMVYFITILFTGSATGYIAVAFGICCYVIKKGINNIYKYVVLAVIIIVVMWEGGVVDYFLKRIATHGASAYSANSRYWSIVGGIFVGITHPLFGAGAIKSNYRFEEFIQFLGMNAAWTNMVTYLFASFGLGYVFIFLYGIYKAIPDKRRSISVGFLLFFCLLLCGETMTYSSIPYIYMMYGYTQRIKNKNSAELLNRSNIL